MSDSPRPPAAGGEHHASVFDRLVAGILRSPFHALLGGNLLLSYRGRRTGLLRELPVAFAPTPDGYAILVGAPERKRWWRNFEEPWPMTVLVDGRTRQATGRVVRGESAAGRALAAAYFVRHPRSGRSRGARMATGEAPDPEALRQASAGLVFVAVEPLEQVASGRAAEPTEAR